MEEAVRKAILRRIYARITALFVVTALVPVVIMALVYVFIQDFNLLLAGSRGLNANGVLAEVTLTAAFAATALGVFTGLLLARRVITPLKLLCEATTRLTDAIGAGRADSQPPTMVSRHSSGIPDIEDAIREATGRLSLIKDYADDIASCVHDALIVTDPYGVIKKVNRAFLDMLKYSEGDAVGKRFGEICDGQDPHVISMVRRDGSVCGLKRVYTSSDGEKIPVTVCASLSNDTIIMMARDEREKASLRDELETTKAELTRRVRHLEEFREGILHMIRNLDRNEKELKDAYNKLKDTQAQLIQSTKLMALGELAAGLAHELNQPLTVIRGITQHIIKRTPDDSQDYEKLVIVESATRKMEKVISHLRTFSRVDEPRLEPIDLNRVIEDAFIMMNELLRKHSVMVEFKPSPLPRIMGNANRLEQVVVNLATNARDAMAGGGFFIISTRCIEENGKKSVRASFADSGSGIPPEIIDRIFEPFFTTKDVDKGTGLGLSISYGIIREHGGTIEVESEYGRGTTFRITIPAME
ncbi:MAG: PAS domain-containing protein [Deltaproteobacteria bacterium]|nr:PAS domain-containing protein [Deltaproteobacteria bacterium]